MRKYQDLVGDNTDYNFNEKSNEIQSSKKDFGNFLKTENKSDDILNNRDNEIGNLVNSINELANIFKHLNTLVLEQGTILDRIDHNIDIGLTNTSQAHKELKKADENMKSNCYRNTNMALILVIFLLAVLNMFKYT
jgi:syntaxin 16